jgi:multiple sugar transport system ATP-binding protein
MASLVLKQVRKSFGPLEVIHGVDLEIADGEFIVFVGPSGCGKSTLMRMVAGLEDITSGEILIDGKVVNDLPPRDRDIAMVFQDYALYPTKSVFENMAFGLRMRRLPEAEVRQRVEKAADMLQITALLDRLPKALSGGQRQRVAMGRAIVREPKVFLFDEPLSNLDALLRNQVRAEIKKLHRRTGGTIIYVTHDQVEAMTLADRIVVLKNGDVVQVGTPDEIYHHPRHRFVAEFTGSPPMNLIDAVIEVDGDAVRARFAEGCALPLPPALAAAGRGYAGEAVVFGVRPEHLRLAGCDTPATWPALDLKIDLVEGMGAENLVHFSLAGRTIVGRFDSDVRPADDSVIKVAFNPAGFHLCDAKTDRALRT